MLKHESCVSVDAYMSLRCVQLQWSALHTMYMSQRTHQTCNVFLRICMCICVHVYMCIQEVSGEQGVNSVWASDAEEAVRELAPFKKIEMLRYLRHLIVVSADFLSTHTYIYTQTHLHSMAHVREFHR